MKDNFEITVEVKLKIDKKEFYKNAISLVEENVLNDKIEKELFQTVRGIVDGESGGSFINWHKVFYFNLFKDGFIELTEKGISNYGDFKTSHLL